MDTVINELQLLKKKNVNGYSKQFLPRIRGGHVVPNEVCLRIYVTKKEPLSSLRANDIIPSTVLLKNDQLVPIDVVEIGSLFALHDRDPKDRCRPLVAGISAMHKDGSACTLNLLFHDVETGGLLVAQNNHCAALENTANVGDAILQPSPYDGGVDGSDTIGYLYKYVELHYSEFTCPFRDVFHRIYRTFVSVPENRVDIAFFEPSVDMRQEVLDHGSITGKITPLIGDRVWKVGRTSGYTEGVVSDLDFNGVVQYSRGVVMFTDCILVEGDGFLQPGDSSSPVQLGNRNVGAGFAGSDTFGIVCKIDNIELEGNVLLFEHDEEQ